MGKKNIVHEDPIVPVYIDRDKELQSYYSCVEALLHEDPAQTTQNLYPSQPAPPPGQWQPPPNNPYGNPWQGYSYPPQPQVGYPSVPPQQTGYPPIPAQQPYPGYAPNPAYPSYPQVPGYQPVPQNSYGAQIGYGGYAQAQMPHAQGSWPAYGQPQPYGGYGQTPQPAPYQSTPYPSYSGYPAEQPGHERVTETLTSSEQSSSIAERSPSAPPSDAYQSQEPNRDYGWDDLMFSGYYDQNYRPYSSPAPSYYSGMQPVEETVTVSQSSRGYVNDDYYAKQFENLQIGWNI